MSNVPNDPLASLLELVRNAARQGVAEALAEQAPVPTAAAPLLDKRALAHALAVSTATVDRLCREGRVPYVVVGDSRRFDLQAVREALANSAASPAPASHPSPTPPRAARSHSVRLLSRPRTP